MNNFDKTVTILMAILFAVSVIPMSRIVWTIISQHQLDMFGYNGVIYFTIIFSFAFSLILLIYVSVKNLGKYKIVKVTE
jgi:hypothetical protein